MLARFLFFISLILSVVDAPLHASREEDEGVKHRYPLQYALFNTLADTYLFHLCQRTGADKALFQENPATFARFVDPDYTPEAFAPFTPKEFVYHRLTGLKFLTLAQRALLVALIHDLDTSCVPEALLEFLTSTSFSTNPWSMTTPVCIDYYAYDPLATMQPFPYAALATNHLTDLSYLPLIQHLVLENSEGLLGHMGALSTLTQLRTLNIEGINFDYNPAHAEHEMLGIYNGNTPAPTHEQAREALGILLEALPNLPHLSTLIMYLPLEFERLRAPLIACPCLTQLVINGPQDVLLPFFKALDEARSAPCDYYIRQENGATHPYDNEKGCFGPALIQHLSFSELSEAAFPGYYTKRFEKESLPPNWRGDLPDDLKTLPLIMYWSLNDAHTHEIVKHTLPCGTEITLGRPRNPEDILVP